MREHLHSGPIHVLYFAAGTLVVIHVLRIIATQVALMPNGKPAAKAIAAFALAD